MEANRQKAAILAESDGRGISPRRKKIASGARGRNGEWVDLHLPEGRAGAVFLHQSRPGGLMAAPHRHDEWEVNLIARGWAEYVVSGRRVRLVRDTLAWLLPRESHLLLAQSPDLVMWVGVFRPALPRRLASGEAFAPWRRWLRAGRSDGRSERVLNEAAATRLNGLCERLHGADLDPAHQAAGLTWLLAEAWRAFTAAADVPAGSHLHPAVERAARFLAEHAADPEADDLEALARRCGVSRPHLSRLFRRQVGLTITELRNRLRVERFAERLGRGGRVTLTEAAYAAGFGSYAQAFRVVRRVTGRSPRRWLHAAQRPQPLAET